MNRLKSAFLLLTLAMSVLVLSGCGVRGYCNGYYCHGSYYYGRPYYYGHPYYYGPYYYHNGGACWRNGLYC